MSVEKNVPQIRFNGFSGDWLEEKLGKVYSFQYGEFNTNPSNGGQYPVYGANGVIGGYTRFNAQSSAVIGHMGEYAGSVLWAEGKHFVTYNGTIAKPKKSDFNPLFGFFSLVKMNLKKVCGGSGQPFLSYDALERLDFTFPSEREQTQIGNYFQKLDNLINQHQQKHDKLSSIKKAMLEKMFPKQGETIPEIRFKGFGGEWGVRSWRDTVDISTNMVDPRNSQYGDLFHVGPGNIESFTGMFYNNVLKVKDSNLISGKFHFNKGDIIYGKINPQLAKYVIAPFEGLASADAYVLNTKNGVIQNYLYAILQTEDFYKYTVSVSSRTGMPKINRDELNIYSYMSPEEEEQEKIGNYFQKLDTLINQHQQQITKLNNIKQACLCKMFV